MGYGICEFDCESTDKFFYVIPNNASTSPLESSEFDVLLISQWNSAKKLGAFTYDLNLLFKTIRGRYELTAQLNCERAKHRRKPQHFKSIRDAFDPHRFNFSKIAREEILMKLVAKNDTNEQNDSNLQENEPLDACVIVNNSPITAGHSLLVPYMSGAIPQILTLKSLKLAVQVILLSSCRFFHVIYNSILAMASVNHLHLHLYYWPYRSKIIDWPVFLLRSGVYVLKDWISPGFVLQLQDRDVDLFCSGIYRIVRYFNESEMPHNLFLARAPELTELDREPDSNSPLYVTCYLFPRKPVHGTKPISTLAPAACEFGGHILVYSALDFQELTEEKVSRIFQEAVLDPGHFEKLCEDIKNMFVG